LNRLEELLQTILIIVIASLAIFTVEVKDMLYAVICLCGMCICIGILFGFLGAPYVMVFQLLIYAGAAVVLFVSVVMLTRRKEE